MSRLESWARPGSAPEAEQAETESRRWLRGLEQGLELAAACPQTRVIVAGDRESDIRELFQQQARHADRAGLLVCAPAGRQRQVRVAAGARTALLTRYLRGVPPVVRGREVAIDSRGGQQPRAQRVARTDVSIARVELQALRSGPPAPPLAVWAVRVFEPDPPPGRAAWEWLLLASDAEGDPAAAARRIAAQYERRVHRGPPPADGRGPGEMSGLRRDHGLARVRGGAHRPRRAAHAGGGRLHAAGAGRDPHHGRGGKAAAPGCRSCPRWVP